MPFSPEFTDLNSETLPEDDLDLTELLEEYSNDRGPFGDYGDDFLLEGVEEDGAVEFLKRHHLNDADD